MTYNETTPATRSLEIEAGVGGGPGGAIEVSKWE